MINQPKILAVVGLLLVAGGIYYFSNLPANDPAEGFEVDRNLSNEDANKFKVALEGADSILAKAEENYKDSRYQGLTQKGAALYGLGKIGESKSALEQALAIHPNNFTAHLGLFRVRDELGDTAGAKESALRAMEIRPKNVEARMLYIDLEANKLAATGDQLKTLYVEGLAKTENDILLVKKYARYLEQAGDKAGAVAQWQKAKEVDAAKAAEYDAEIARLEKA